MTDTLKLIPAEPVLTALAQLQETVAGQAAALKNLLESERTAPAYLPLHKLAARYGLSRRKAEECVAAAANAGVMRTLAPSDGIHKGATLYSVEAFEAWAAQKYNVQCTKDKSR